MKSIFFFITIFRLICNDSHNAASSNFICNEGIIIDCIVYKSSSSHNRSGRILYVYLFGVKPWIFRSFAEVKILFSNISYIATSKSLLITKLCVKKKNEIFDISWRTFFILAQIPVNVRSSLRQPCLVKGVTAQCHDAWMNCALS